MIIDKHNIGDIIIAKKDYLCIKKDTEYIVSDISHIFFMTHYTLSYKGKTIDWKFKNFELEYFT
jgi:hypothetical protein